MPDWTVSTIEALDPQRLPSEGLSVNEDEGTLSYCVEGQGATIRLSPMDALRIAVTLHHYAKRCLDLAEADVGGRA